MFSDLFDHLKPLENAPNRHVNFLEENLRGAPPPSMPDEALTIVRQIVAEMRGVQATEGIRGVTRYMAAAVNDPRVEFDGMLKLAGPRAILFWRLPRQSSASSSLLGDDTHEGVTRMLLLEHVQGDGWLMWAGVRLGMVS